MRQIVEAQDAAACANAVDDRGCERARVERLRPFFRDNGEGAGELLLAKPAGRSRYFGRPVRLEEDRHRVVEGFQACGGRRGLREEILVDRNAFGKPDGGREKLFPRFLALRFVQHRERGDGAWHGDRAVARLGGVVDGGAPAIEPVALEIGVDELEHRLVRLLGCSGASFVTARCGALRIVRHGIGAAAEAAHEGLDHRNRERGGDGRIGRVAAAS